MHGFGAILCCGQGWQKQEQVFFLSRKKHVRNTFFFTLVLKETGSI